MSKKIIKKLSACMGAAMACTMVVGVAGSIQTKSATASNDKTAFSSEITAVSHAYGETIQLLPEEVKLWNESEKFDAAYLNGLYEYTTLHQEFVTAVGKKDNDANVAEMYRQLDAFNPVNNVLKWESSLANVASYTVRVAYDYKFTQCILKEENADMEEGVLLENPLAGTDYYWQVIAVTNSGDRIYSPIFNFTTADTLRTVTIDGVSNTRDIGGYETAYGYVKQGLVYRSARLESITEEGMETLKNGLGIKTDLDLRGKAEANTGANRENPLGLDEAHYQVFDTPQYAYTGELGMDSEAHIKNVAKIMKVFTDKNNYPIDVHCAVGRDRTGTITALLKAVLGYAENDITNDYFTSMFATTGAWSKETTFTNYSMIMNVLSYLNSFEGETLADRAANYLITECEMSQEDIDAIRDIMTGKVEVEIPAEKTVEDTDNYAEYSFVTFEKFGTAKVLTLVGANEKVTAPFEAGEGYVWMVDGQEYDFDAIVTKDMTVKAIKPITYEVTINATGAFTSQETVTVSEGATFDLTSLEKSGYDCIVISDEGQVITELTVVENTTLNVIYLQK